MLEKVILNIVDIGNNVVIRDCGVAIRGLAGTKDWGPACKRENRKYALFGLNLTRQHT